jgi:uncharacterized protein YbbK (DUF523 family)
VGRGARLTNPPRPTPARLPLPRVGVSACLLGERVRYDGGHKLQPSLVEALEDHVEWVPVCPEVEAGFGVPRPPMRLVGSPGAARMVVTATGDDKTAAMDAFCSARLDALAALALHGWVLKARSPSCGLRDVPVFGRGDDAPAAGSGLFARALVLRFPDLPVADEDDLADPAARDRFLARVRARVR